jgi:hypothetical protein
MFHVAAEQIGEFFRIHQDKAKDPLIDALGMLESN